MKIWISVTLLLSLAFAGCAGGSRGTGTSTKTLYPPLTLEERVLRDKQDTGQDCRIPGKCHRGNTP